MSNAVFINLVSMTHYTLELRETYVSYGFKISDDQLSTFCDLWETIDDFLSDIGITGPVTADVLARSLVNYILKDGSDDATEIVRGGLDYKLSFYICDECYDWAEVSGMLGEVRCNERG